MRIAIITGNQPSMLYLAHELSQKYNVTDIFHFQQNALSQTNNAKKIIGIYHFVKKFGFRWSLRKILYRTISNINHQLSDGYKETNSAYAKYSDAYFSKMNPSVRRHYLNDVNSAESIAKIAAANADIVACHGGPIYSQQLISACKLVLNYHSGISPIYNGSDSHLFAFSNAHPHLCGGTLMLMNTKVDGGDVLSHYLPEIISGDTPSTIFTKCIRGSFILYDNFLEGQDNQIHEIKGRPQSKPTYYFRKKDWNINRYLKLRRNLKNNVAQYYERPEYIVAYWNNQNRPLLNEEDIQRGKIV